MNLPFSLSLSLGVRAVERTRWHEGDVRAKVGETVRALVRIIWLPSLRERLQPSLHTTIRRKNDEVYPPTGLEPQI